MLRRITKPAAPALRKLPKPLKPYVIEFTPTPYRYSEEHGRAVLSDRVPLGMLYFWMQDALAASAATADGTISHYEFARELGVHRVVADEWIKALVQTGYMQYVKGNGVELLKLRENLGGKDYRDEFDIEVQHVDYDPWTDRSWDKHFNDPWFPYNLDEYVDDYYHVFADEHLLRYGERRTRPNGKLFRPMKDCRHEKDHPLCFLRGKDGKRFRQKNGRPIPPPAHRKREIDQACTSQAGKTGVGPKTPQPEFKSWLKCDFDKLPAMFAKSSGDSDAPQAAAGPRVRKRRPGNGEKAAGGGLRIRRRVPA